MKIDQLIPTPSDRVRFQWTFFRSVPKEAGCYVLTTFEADILYFGLAENLFDRFQQHLNSPDKVKPTGEGKAIWFYFMRFNSTNLPMLERTWIYQFEAVHGRKPILNKVNSPLR